MLHKLSQRIRPFRRDQSLSVRLLQFPREVLRVRLKYMNKISGPIIDRVDFVLAMKNQSVLEQTTSDTSQELAANRDSCPRPAASPVWRQLHKCHRASQAVRRKSKFQPYPASKNRNGEQPGETEQPVDVEDFASCPHDCRCTRRRNGVRCGGERSAAMENQRVTCPQFTDAVSIHDTPARIQSKFLLPRHHARQQSPADFRVERGHVRTEAHLSACPSGLPVHRAGVVFHDQSLPYPG